jgi:transposase-like protein
MKIAICKNDSISAGSKVSATSLAALPPTNTTRWVASRKAAVVAAVQAGVLTVMEACRAYGLSHEEFAEWQRHYEAEGLKGLRARARRRQPDYPMN